MRIHPYKEVISLSATLGEGSCVSLVEYQPTLREFTTVSEISTHGERVFKIHYSTVELKTEKFNKKMTTQKN